MRSWKVIDSGTVPPNARKIEYTCMGCMREALLPVVGTVLAQLDAGLVFDTDTDKRAIPKQIQCPHCRKRMEAA